MLYRFRRRLWHLCPKLNVEYVYTHNLQSIPERNCKIPIKIFKLSLDKLDRIWEVKKMPLKKLKNRLERGDICYVTEYDNKLIAYQWVQFSGNHFIQQAGLTIKVKQFDLWMYHARVLKKFRNNGINTKIKRELMKDACEQGFKKAIIYTNKKNIPNRMGLEKLGFRLNEIIYSFKIKNKYYKVFNKKLE